MWSVISAIMLLMTPMFPLSAPFKARLGSPSAQKLSGAMINFVVPEDEPPECFRQAERIHGERETNQAEEGHGFSADMVRESAPMENSACLGCKE